MQGSVDAFCPALGQENPAEQGRQFKTCPAFVYGLYDPGGHGNGATEACPLVPSGQ